MTESNDELFEMVRAAYERGYNWGQENPDSRPFLNKAAYDYADKTTSALALRTPSDGEVACGAVGYFQEHPEGSWRQVPDQWADLPNTRPLYARPQGMEVTDAVAADVASRLFERRWGEGTGLTRSALTAEVKDAITAALSPGKE